eukprot:7221150-Prymnesium_polylepis.1
MSATASPLGTPFVRIGRRDAEPAWIAASDALGVGGDALGRPRHSSMPEEILNLLACVVVAARNICTPDS